MQNKRKKLEELNLLDDFLFNALMTYPEMGEAFTRKAWRGRTPCRD